MPLTLQIDATSSTLRCGGHSRDFAQHLIQSQLYCGTIMATTFTGALSKKFR
jgi:hypothetical protein